MRKVIWFLVLDLAMWNTNIYAGRPLTTEDAGVAGKDVFQLELSIDYAKEDGDRGFSFLAVPIYGISERLELSIELPYVWNSPKDDRNVNGFEDFRLIAKCLIVEEGQSSPAFTLKALGKFGNGRDEKGLGSGANDFGFVAVATKTFGDLILHANIGYTFTGKTDEVMRNYALYGIGAEYPLSERFRVVGEVYGEGDSHFDVGAFRHNHLQGLVGFTYAFSESITFDSGVKFGLTHNNGSDYGLTCGISITF